MGFFVYRNSSKSSNFLISIQNQDNYARFHFTLHATNFSEESAIRHLQVPAHMLIIMLEQQQPLAMVTSCKDLRPGIY
jgi:hypothetical protein